MPPSSKLATLDQVFHTLSSLWFSLSCLPLPHIRTLVIKQDNISISKPADLDLNSIHNFNFPLHTTQLIHRFQGSRHGHLRRSIFCLQQNERSLLDTFQKGFSFLDQRQAGRNTPSTSGSRCLPGLSGVVAVTGGS